MLNALIGALITVCFSLCLYGAYTLGRRQRKLDTAQQLTEQEELEVEKRMKGMQNVMEYDYEVAIGKKVNHGR
jgi:cbb3-type cytochrome oxidase subunit 3